MKRAMTLRGWSGDRTTVDAPPAIPKHQAKKNTKRWCRGKVGVEHRFEWIHDTRYDYQLKSDPRTWWWTEKCIACGKHDRYCMAMFSVCICGNHK